VARLVLGTVAGSAVVLGRALGRGWGVQKGSDSGSRRARVKELESGSQWGGETAMEMEGRMVRVSAAPREGEMAQELVSLLAQKTAAARGVWLGGSWVER